MSRGSRPRVALKLTTQSIIFVKLLDCLEILDVSKSPLNSSLRPFKLKQGDRLTVQLGISSGAKAKPQVDGSPNVLLSSVRMDEGETTAATTMPIGDAPAEHLTITVTALGSN